MSQFVVPQFIDVEDKILGPITTRQFAILMITALVMFIIYKILYIWYAVAVDVVLLGSALVVAFVRINGQPFHYFLLNFIQTFRRPNVRVWNKDLTDAEIIALAKVEIPPPPPPKVYKEAPTTSRLSELALVVNTGGVYHPED
ncbi:MAG TPA: PrgI family protein [Candidatus Baltobacteraceae bacterium]|nr:PrgI family protein [Candidatus Baltobacteraceae bacterium]